ncbi:EF-hand calcium-binding domain-containing protein 4A-like [Procambarus clarkii]|uniref:EF-hand calcium-binding domain-containing protein 4A-like n=1 Tax=Procambarus clarkii TaxID=6728 RepID=UPI003743780A
MAEKATIDDLDDVQAFLNREDCLARLKYLGKQELVLVSAYLEIKIRASDSHVEILSKVHKHLKAEEKQEGEAHSIKEGDEIASTEKEDKHALATMNALKEREAALVKETLQIREREAAIRKEEEERETALLRERERVQLEAKQRHLEMQREHNKKQAEMAIACR